MLKPLLDTVPTDEELARPMIVDPTEPVAAPKPAAISPSERPAEKASKKEPEKKQPPPKPTEFRFHCFLCGSLLYAREEQIGGMINCHDCHSPNEVRPPKQQDWQKPSDGPSMDDAEDFALSPTFERPKFEPIERPKPPEDDEGDLPMKPLTVTPTQAAHPGAQPAAGRPASPVPGSAIPQPSQFSPQSTANKPGNKPPPPAPPPVRTHAETYGDELWSEPADNGRPPFERSPFLVGILEYMLYPSTLPRWLALTALAAIPIAAIEVSSGSAGMFFAAILGLPWLAVLGAHAMAIVGDTARGRDAIEDWPLVGNPPNLLPPGNPKFLAVAAAAAVLPGLMYFLVLGGETAWGWIVVLVSLLFLLPITWLPMLLEKSLQGPLQSQTFWQSFRHSGSGWITFAFETLLLSVVGAGGMSLLAYGTVIVAPLAAVLVVTPLFLYFRLLGRMLWFIDPAMAPPPPPSSTAAHTSLPDTVDPTQVRPWR